MVAGPLQEQNSRLFTNEGRGILEAMLQASERASQYVTAFRYVAHTSL